MKRRVLAILASTVLVCLIGGPRAEARRYDSVHFLDAQTGYVTGDNLLLRSSDGGETWSVLLGPGGPEALEDASFLRFVSPNLGWFRDLDTKRVFLTTDGGRTWSPRSLEIQVGPPGSGATAPVSFFEFVSPTEAWGAALASGEGVYHSTDGGRTWNLRRVPGAFPTIPVGGMTFLDPQTGWLQGRDGFRMTTDGGRTWSPPLGSVPVFSLIGGTRFLSPAVGWMLGQDRRLYRTTDGGRTWTAPSLPIDPAVQPIEHFFFLTPTLGWASGRRGLVLKTTDGGDTWTALPTGTIADLDGVHFVTEQLGWAVGSFSMILKTTDGGQTWKQVSDGEVQVDPSGRPSP